MRAIPGIVASIAVATGVADASWLDRLDRSLVVETPDRNARVEVSGRADLESFFVDERPPGLIFGGDGIAWNPRFTLFVDAQIGSWLYGFVQARADRGFDPRLEPDGDVRADEFFVRATPFEKPVFQVQAGKFATVVGNWVARHQPPDNAFVNAPLPYENVTIVADRGIVPDPEAFLARRSLPDQKDLWLPILWGPSYASGLAVFGQVADVDYAAEVKNAAISSRPSEWEAWQRDWEHPTASARLGWRPSMAWSLGASYSDGPYLRKSSAGDLPAGSDPGDFRQRLAGADVRYAWRHLELWSELFLARFEVPNVGDADTLAWYVESRYGLTPDLSLGLRANQQLFGTVEGSDARDRRWDRDVWRLDHALVWRLDRHTEAKVQYSYARQSGGLQQGEQFAAVQLSVWF